MRQIGCGLAILSSMFSLLQSDASVFDDQTLAETFCGVLISGNFSGPRHLFESTRWGERGPICVRSVLLRIRQAKPEPPQG
jgi:hypothetical protein